MARYTLAASSATTLHRPAGSRPSTVASATTRSTTAMPHPILKKTRGPSTTGPRPTARFVSPHESEKETDSSSSVSSNSHVVVQPPSPDANNVKLDGKPSAPGRKKPGFVASKAAKKKRPVLSRRQSSQTSQSSAEKSSTDKSPVEKSSADRSPTDSRTANSTGQAQPSLQTGQPGTSEQKQSRSKKPTQSKFQEELSPPHRPSVKTSDSKSKGPSNNIDLNNSLSSSRESQMIKSDGAIPDTVEQGPSHQQQSGLHYDPLQQNRPSAPGEKSPRRGAAPSKEKRQGQTLRETPKPRSSGSTEPVEPARPFKSAASLAPTLTAATAQVSLGDPMGNGSGHTPPSPRAGSSKSKDPNQRRPADLFAKRPVQPIVDAVVPAPAGSLSKSKSQLTLLLEKDRARSGNHASPNSKR